MASPKMSFLAPPWYRFVTFVSTNKAASVSIYGIFSALRLEEV
jgi:hypothetical protein